MEKAANSSLYYFQVLSREAANIHICLLFSNMKWFLIPLKTTTKKSLFRFPRCMFMCVCVFTLGLILSLVTIGGFILAAIGLVLFLGGLMVGRL